jgi:hypothetical protein
MSGPGQNASARFHMRGIPDNHLLSGTAPCGRRSRGEASLLPASTPPDREATGRV